MTAILLSFMSSTIFHEFSKMSTYGLKIASITSFSSLSGFFQFRKHNALGNNLTTF